MSVYYTQLERLKESRKNVNWQCKVKRARFIYQLSSIVKPWLTVSYLNLRDIFRPEEIDILLTDCICMYLKNQSSDALAIIEFVDRTGYKDKPDVDNNGKPSPRRTTPVHHTFGQNEFLKCTDLIEKLFKIYMRFDVNYTDEFGLTHFHVACRHGLNGIVEKFLEHGQVDPNCLAPETGDSPLHLALRRGDGKSVELLLKRGANPNAANKEGMTPLHNICKYRYNNVEFAKMLFELSDEKYHPVQIDVENQSGETPLYLAVENNSRVLAKLLLKKGADPNTADKKGVTPLHLICSRNDREWLDLFFRINDEIQQTVQINAQDRLGRTALHYALVGPNDSLVELLLRRGIDPNLPDDKGTTPLHCICNKSDAALELAELFFRINNEIQQTVQIDARDKLGRAPLHEVVRRGCKNYTRVLLRNGADPNLAKKCGSTPLHIICESKYDNDELAKMLFELSDEKYHPVQIDARDEWGNTPLHLALSKGHKKVVELLLRGGSDPHLTNAEGLTSLQIICKFYSGDGMAKILFEICDERHQTLLVNALDNEDRTPLQWAVATLKPHMVGVLLDHGADLSNFIFPTDRDFLEYVTIYKALFGHTIQFKLTVTLGILGVIESLEKGGYELDLSDALMIMMFLARDGLFEMKVKFDESWFEDENFVSESKKLMIIPSMSFYDFVRLSPKKADKRLTCADYFRFLEKHYNHDLILSLVGNGVRFKEHLNNFLPERTIIQTCAVYLCEKLVRRFIRSWALDCFMELIHNRLPILCCEMIIDQLMNRDLRRICIAANKG